jgi:hypothetical protein
VLRHTTILVALLFVLFAGSTAAAPTSVRHAFADGTWRGTAPLGGTISRPNITVSGRGTGRFLFTVRGGRVTSGHFTYDIAEHGSISGNTFTGHVTATLRVAGPASKPTVRGPVTVVASVLGQTVRVSVPADGDFKGSGTCDRMTGDLSIKARQAQQAAGFQTSVTANFVARRISGGACS